MRANTDEYKEKKKKEPYTLGGWRTRCADGLACGWSCVWMALHADADRGGYRGGERG